MLISIIIPIYNAEKFLNKCLESVINQSYKNIEIILINDGSNDGGELICNKYAFADKRIKLFSQKNSGPAAARNTGLNYASGDLVFFLDADDYIEENTMEILLENYEKYTPDLVISNFNKLEGTSRLIKQNVTFTPNANPFTQKNKELSREDIVNFVRHFLKYPSNHLISYCWARLYKMSIINQYNIKYNNDMRLFEDYIFNLEYLSHCNKVVFVNEYLYNYVMHDSYISASMTMLNSNSLLNDMQIFKEKTSKYLKYAQANCKTKKIININKEIGQALVHYVIIFIVRSCRQKTKENKSIIANEIHNMLNSKIFINSLRRYSPLKGNSIIIPWLMKLQTVGLLMHYCNYRSNKRYGKLPVGLND
jgi:glycosyltransferase involved in cell wall biosynthesis